MMAPDVHILSYLFVSQNQTEHTIPSQSAMFMFGNEIRSLQMKESFISGR